MNHQLRTILAATALLALSSAAQAGIPVINLHATSTIDNDSVILDVFVDTNGIPLRSFGIQVKFNPEDLSLDSAGRYDQLWYLAHESGAHLAYTDAELVEEDCVRIVGGRLDASQPDEGVNGNQILMATLLFKRLNGATPEFRFALASPAPFANFVRVGGESVDPFVDLEEVPVTEQAPSEDIDNDGLPDSFEIATFGDLTTSGGTTDTDHDGESDLDEWIKGTDPTDPGSKCTLSVEVLPDGSKLVQWSGKLGRVYELERSDGLNSFDVLASGIPGENGLVLRQDATDNSDPDGFYRVKTSFPTAGR